MEVPPLHPVIVHAPIALIVIALLFDIIGRATDLAWWRKAAFAMLITGVVGAWFAVQTGDIAEDALSEPGDAQHEAIEAHEAAGIFTWWMGLIAVAARVLETRGGAARGAISVIALVAHLLAAGGAGLAGYRGGILVYDYGTGVKAQPAVAGGAEQGSHEHDHDE